MLGLCLAARDQRPEAEALLLASHRTLEGAKNWYHRMVRDEVRKDLVRLYRSWGDPTDAARFQALLDSSELR
jgi:hypothetical protein